MRVLGSLVNRPSLTLIILLLGSAVRAWAGDVMMTFTVSMPERASHLYHVKLRCEGLTGELHDFKLPRWTPGFYQIIDYGRNVLRFSAADGTGRALPWEKTENNTWRVAAGNAVVLVLNYDVLAETPFPADSYIGEDRGFITPASMFVNLDGVIRRPATVEIHLPVGWSISTGLDGSKTQPNVFDAPDFDVLYDCPILMGQQERLMFEVKGVPHLVVIENVPAEINRGKMLTDIKAIVTAATDLMGDVPYSHYTFMIMGRGAGGIEHANSSADQFDGKSLTSPAGYIRWLSFIAHEYFHNFNVKRIRPLALGPFDYEQENITNMLWVSEGLSVYYQDLLLVRAGLMSRDAYLAHMAKEIGAFQNSPGRHYESATEASRETWNSGSGVRLDRNVSISYYDNGAMLGAMLDLNIRSATKGRKSLDDVMRSLYRKYYLTEKRGFTDSEFRAECENAAGTSLPEIFDYASQPKEMDYARYFGIAGLKLDVSSATAPGGWIGLDTRTEEMPPQGAGRRNSSPSVELVVTDIAAGSPAVAAGIRIGDRITSVNGMPAAAKLLSDAVKQGADTNIQIRWRRAGNEMNATVQVAPNIRQSYRLTIADGATGDQKRILSDWLRPVFWSRGVENRTGLALGSSAKKNSATRR